MIKASKNRFISLIVVAAMIIGIMPMGILPAFAATSLVTAASTPEVVANGSNQTAGNITVMEDTDTPADWGAGSKTFIMTLPGTFVFTAKPTVAAAGGTTTIIESAVLSANNQLTVTVSGNNTSRDGFTITNVKYDCTTASSGNLSVTLTGTLPNIPGSIVNAKIVPGLSATTIPATSTAKVQAGLSNQAADQIRLTESDTGTVRVGNTVKIKIATAGVTFSDVPTVAGTNGLALGAGVSGDSGKSFTWTVGTASTTTSATYTFSNIKYDVAAGTSSGTITVDLSTNATNTVTGSVIPVSPASVSNAKITVTGTTASASSVPVIKKDTNMQAAGNIVISENAAGNVSTGTISLDISNPGVAFYGLPEATATGGMQLSTVTATSVDSNTVTWTVTQSTTNTAGAITISGIKYNVMSTTASGPVVVALSGTPVTAANVVNATVETTKVATVSAPIQTIIPASSEAQAVGDVVISESAKGKLLAGHTITLTIQPNGNGQQDVFFAADPTLVVSAGNIILTPVSVSADRSEASFGVTSISTIASTIKVTGIKLNTLGSASGAVFVNVDDNGTSLGMVSNAFVGTLTPTFSDVPATHWAFNAIEFLASAGIVSGRTSGDFDPNASITRGEFAKIICLAAGLTPVTGGTPSFSDTSGNWAAGYIEAAKAAGLIGGYPDGTFRPNALITRAEIAKMVVEGAGFATDTSGAGFSDIATSWAKDFILTAANNGVVNGYSDGTFRPGNHATRAEASVMVYNWLSGK